MLSAPACRNVFGSGDCRAESQTRPRWKCFTERNWARLIVKHSRLGMVRKCGLHVEIAERQTLRHGGDCGLWLLNARGSAPILRPIQTSCLAGQSPLPATRRNVMLELHQSSTHHSVTPVPAQISSAPRSIASSARSISALLTQSGGIKTMVSRIGRVRS